MRVRDKPLSSLERAGRKHYVSYKKDTHCIDVDRKDDIDVIYKEVKRS